MQAAYVIHWLFIRPFISSSLHRRIMWSLFGLRKDSKKSTPDKEVDGGFVIVGECQVKIARHIKQLLASCLNQQIIL